MRSDLQYTGHWEQRDRTGTIVQRTNEYTEKAYRVHRDLRVQAISLLGKPISVDDPTLTARNITSGATVRFVVRQRRLTVHRRKGSPWSPEPVDR